jgi:hypothetical protein
MSLAQNVPVKVSGDSTVAPKSPTIVMAELTNGAYVPVTIKNYRPGAALPLQLTSNNFITDPGSPFDQVDARRVKRLWTIRNSPSGIPYGALIGGVIGGLAGLLRYDEANTLYRDYEKMGAYTGVGIGAGAVIGILAGHIISPGGPTWKVIWPCSPSQ